jgi:hypothetical protein
MKFSYYEYIQEIDHLEEFWADYKLPDPGCAMSRQLMHGLIHVLHRTNLNISVDFRTDLEALRTISIKAMLSSKLQYKRLTTYPQKVEPTQTGESEKSIQVVHFYFPLKNKVIIVPLDDNSELWTDLSLVRCLLSA